MTNPTPHWKERFKEKAIAGEFHQEGFPVLYLDIEGFIETEIATAREEGRKEERGKILRLVEGLYEKMEIDNWL